MCCPNVQKKTSQVKDKNKDKDKDKDTDKEEQTLLGASLAGIAVGGVAETHRQRVGSEHSSGYLK